MTVPDDDDRIEGNNSGAPPAVENLSPEPALREIGSGDGVHPSAAFKLNARIYAIVIGLGITNLLAALENTVVSVAAPVIFTELQLGDDYVWVTNAFFLCSTAIQPLFGQLCNIFGRRYVMLAVVTIFVLGSGICGGATTSGMLIAGRAVQGAGSGGIIMVSSIIISDLVPLRQRGNISAILMAIFGIGSALGPFIGGAIVSSTTWRWVFYMNLPIGGAAFIILLAVLRVSYSKEMSFWRKLKRMDLVGNGILVASTVSILYALSYAGTRYLWQSWHTLVPLLSVKLYSPRRAGVALLPISLLGIPGSVLGAIALTHWGRYKPIHIIAFAVQTLGLGLLTLQDENTTVAEWAVFQCIVSFGLGMVFSTMLPAFQAFVHERDLAACTAAWYFIRLFGHVWGVAIPSAVFNDRVNTLLAQGAISDPQVASSMAGGGAYQAASAAFVEQFSTTLQAEVRAVYREATQRVFQVAIVFSGVAFLLTLFEKEVELRKTLETEFGLEERRGEKPRGVPGQ
ncbi:major facilitator superfamily domain-containing protein [Hypoxylon cercidicola]|nr:major facilitator superfamily domain-containing protein [Hypoxylon cercidicola]